MSAVVEALAFTDGAAKGNPGPGGWGAVLCIAGATVRELGGSSAYTTNNRMELTGALEALRWLERSAGAESVEVRIVSDSTYVVRGVTQWLAGWRRRGWKTAEGTEVANRDLWEALDDLVGDGRVAAGGRSLRVRWQHVRGHAGIGGNERADAIATAFAAGTAPKLYHGPYASYGIDLDETAAPAAAARPRGRHWYLSVVDGVPARHETWEECEKRVRGRSGARFKKIDSAAAEEALLAAWGL